MESLQDLKRKRMERVERVTSLWRKGIGNVIKIPLTRREQKKEISLIINPSKTKLMYQNKVYTWNETKLRFVIEDN